MNNTSAAVDQTLTVGGDSVRLNLPGGPYLRIAATNVQADLLGLRVTGDFASSARFDLGADRLPGGMNAASNADTTIIRIGIANLAFSLGGVPSSVSGGSGAFFVTPAGIAGELQATVALERPAGVVLRRAEGAAQHDDGAVRRDVPGRLGAAPRDASASARSSGSPARTST